MLRYLELEWGIHIRIRMKIYRILSVKNSTKMPGCTETKKRGKTMKLQMFTTKLTFTLA